MQYAFALFFLLLIAQLMQLDHRDGGRLLPKGIKSKTFPQGYVISLSGVVVRCSRVPVPVFFVLLFSINIYLNSCYLIKCNKQQEKYRVSSKKIVHRILNMWINNLNFYHFLQFTVGKPELITT